VPPRKPTPAKYPSPDELNLPEPGHISPDQTYYIGWLTQHYRLWAMVGVLTALLISSIAANFMQAKRYVPVIRYVTLDHGYPVLVSAEGEFMVDGHVYHPGPMRALVKSFIEHRYAYNWQDLQKINRAVDHLSARAQEVERGKIAELDLPGRVFAVRATWRLELDMDQWQVQALGNGRFRVKIPGTAKVNDALRHTDPANPFLRKFEIDLVIATVPRTEANVFGYEIVETGPDILH
jgi:hypothetical protein